MKEPILVIMAAGMGSRYGGLKQIDPIGKHDEKIIDYSVFDAKVSGFKRLVFIINKTIERDFKEIIGKKLEAHLEIQYTVQAIEDLPESIQRPKDRIKPWGTGHAIYSARHLIDAPFAVINADDFYGRDAFQKMYHFLKEEVSEDTYSMVGFQLKNTVTEHGYVSRGICEVINQKLVTITERVHIESIKGRIHYLNDEKLYPLKDDQLVSMNMWGFHQNIFKDLEKIMVAYLQEALKINPLKCEFFLPYIVDQALKNNKSVLVLETSEKWYGVTYKEDKPKVVNAISELTLMGLYPEQLWERKDVK